MLPTPVFLPGKPHGHRSLVGYSPWCCKKQTRLSNYTTPTTKVSTILSGLPWWRSPKESTCSAGDVGDTGSIRGSQRSPGEATHSGVLAWRTPWTEEPGGLHFIGLPRVGHHGSDWACTMFIMLGSEFYIKFSFKKLRKIHRNKVTQHLCFVVLETRKKTKFSNALPYEFVQANPAFLGGLIIYFSLKINASCCFQCF